jgi:hypothetical protein
MPVTGRLLLFVACLGLVTGSASAATPDPLKSLNIDRLVERTMAAYQQLAPSSSGWSLGLGSWPESGQDSCIGHQGLGRFRPCCFAEGARNLLAFDG